MLKEIFRTVAIPYAKQGSENDESYPPGTIIGGWHGGANKAPYLENINHPSGIYLQPSPWPHNTSSPSAAANLLVFTYNQTDWWPGFGFGYYRFDPVNGKFLRRMTLQESIGMLMVLSTHSYRSRSGKYFFGHIWSDQLIEIDLGKSATELMYAINEDGKENTKDDFDTATPKGSTPASHFTKEGTPLLFLYHPMAIDDMPSVDIKGKAIDYFLMASGATLSVYKWTLGTWLYDVPMPATIVDIALETEGRAYILLATRVIFLFDYLRGEVLGMARMPVLTGNTQQMTVGDTRISWDSMYRRLLICEKTPNKPDGASTTVVRGYRMVSIPTRMTRPIPLIKPRQHRIVPVLTQIVGDLNEGIGGYVVQAEVTGSGSLLGIPMTDHFGNGIIHVLCNGKGGYGYDDYGGYDDGGYDGSTSGKATAGIVHINAKVIVYQPDPKDIPVSGVTPGPGGGTPGGPDPGDGDGGGDYGPNEMPNMQYIIDQLFSEAAPDGQKWNLNEANEDAINGRGNFTAIAVQRMHDVDARFGHFLKTGGHNKYDPDGNGVGGAVDAVCFINDDGVTSEGADIVSGSGNPGWSPYKRGPRVPAGDYNSWVYPAP